MGKRSFLTLFKAVTVGLILICALMIPGFFKHKHKKTTLLDQSLTHLGLNSWLLAQGPVAHEGELCKNGDIDLRCVDIDPEKRKYTNFKTSLHCQRLGPDDNSIRPCIAATDENQLKCYADWECCSGYCDLNMNEYNANEIPSQITPGTCKARPSSGPNSTRDLIPSIKSSGLAAGQACQNNSQCQSKECQAGQCSHPQACLRCTRNGYKPAPGAPCCHDSQVPIGSDKCTPVDPSGVEVAIIADALEGPDQQKNIDAINQQLLDRFAVTLSPNTCDFSYTIAGGSTTSELGQKINQELVANTNFLSLFQFLYGFRNPAKDNAKVTDIWGTHDHMRDIYYILGSTQYAAFTSTQALGEVATAVNELVLNAGTIQMSDCTKSSGEKFDRHKLLCEKLGKKLDLAQRLGMSTIESNYRPLTDPIPAPCQAIVKDSKNQKVANQNARTAQLEGLRMMKNLSEQAAVLSKVYYQALGQAMDMMNNFETKNHFVNKHDPVKSNTYNVLDLIYGKYGWVRKSQNVKMRVDQEEAEEGVDEDELEEQDGSQSRAFYARASNRRCHRPENEVFTEESGQYEGEREWAEETDDKHSLSVFCTGDYSSDSNGGYRATKIHISTFPVYVFSLDGNGQALSKTVDAAIFKAKINLRKYIEDQATYSRGYLTNTALGNEAPLYQLDPQTKEFLNTIANADDKTLENLLNLTSKAQERRGDSAAHPTENLGATILLQNQTISKLTSYYEKMNPMFEQRAICLQEKICQLAQQMGAIEPSCSGSTSGQGPMDGSSSTAYAPKVEGTGSHDAKAPGGPKASEIKSSLDNIQLLDGTLGQLIQAGQGQIGLGLSNGKNNQRIIQSSTIGKVKGLRSSLRSQLAAAKKERDAFNEKWKGTSILSDRSSVGRSSEDFKKEGGDVLSHARAVSLKAMEKVGQSTNPFSALKTADQQTNEDKNAADDKNKKGKNSADSFSNNANGAKTYDLSAYQDKNGDNNTLTPGQKRMLEEVKKHPSEYKSKEGDSIFKIITNRYMKSLDRILPNLD